MAVRGHPLQVVALSPRYPMKYGVSPTDALTRLRRLGELLFRCLVHECEWANVVHHLLARLVQCEEVWVVATGVSEVEADRLRGNRRQSFRVIEVHQRGVLGHRLVPDVAALPRAPVVALVVAPVLVVPAATDRHCPLDADVATVWADDHALRTVLGVVP